jgi:hypothetical protein
MKKYLFILLAICISQFMVLNVSAQGSSVGWSTATDASGNVFATGFFMSPTITFGTTTLTNAATGYDDIYIVKYDPSGNVLWAKSAGGTNSESARNIATDGSGNVYLTGWFYSPTITFGSFTLINAASGVGDMFIVKYSASGTVLWAKRAGGSLMDVGSDVVADVSGNVYVTGQFKSSSITFGSFILTNPLPGSWVMFVVKYDPNGNVLSAAGWCGANATGIATDGIGNVYLTGVFMNSTITFGSFTLTNAASGLEDIFTVKFNGNGTVLWAISAGGSNNDAASDIATDGSGDVYLTGSFQSSTITFGEITLTNNSTSLIPEDMFIVKYDPSGTALWAKIAGGISVNRGSGIATDGNGNVYVTGPFCLYPITFGTIILPNGGAWDMFIVKYDASGNVPWAKRAGGSKTEYGRGIATDRNGNVFVIGDFGSSTITFGTITLNNTYGTNTSNYTDIFIAKYDANGNVPWAKCAGGATISKPKSADAGIDNTTANEITVYPNPTSGKVILSTTNSQSTITSISVFNITGKKVFSRQSAVGSQQLDVDLSSQSKGLYILLIKVGENVYRRKIILE